MNLKDFLASREKPPELFWSLVLEPGWVQAGIWYIGEEKAEIVDVSPPAAWETEEELTGAVDAALSSSIQKLPEEYEEPSKTVFGVPSVWVKEGEIQEGILTKIKNICNSLSLTPVGFVVLPEAVAHLYKSLEGSPLSAIIIGLGKDALEVTAFKLGNLVGTTSVARSVSLLEDVTEGLARFEGAAPLPSRLIVYDGKGGELMEAKEALMASNWDEDRVKFLHTPKVEVLISDKKVVATALAGANEIGHVTKVSSEEKESIPKKEEVENVAVSRDNLNPEELGFVVGKDVSVKVAPPNPSPVAKEGTSALKKIGESLGHFAQNFKPKVKIKPLALRGSPYWLVAFGALFVAVAVYWWFYPKALVTVYVSPRSFSQDADISFSTNESSDIANGVIPAQTLTTEVSGDKTKATSGVKLIGDKAKGSVNILNFTQNVVTLSPGTILSSGGNLRFTTVSEASISAVVANGSENIPGSTSVNVIAADIGSQYNLPKDEIFIVGNYSKINVRAQATSDFTGGSSQQISAVSKQDQSSLEDQLKNELSQKAKDELSVKVSTNQIFAGDLAGVDIASESFDHKVGDEADNLKLSLSLNITGIAADHDKLLEYARGVLRDKIPAGFTLKDSQINFKFTFVEQKDGVYKYKINIGANFLPQVNGDSIAAKIAGKSTRVAVDFLASIPGYVRADAKIKPHFPGFFGTLPHVSKNITIDVAAEQ